MSSEAEPGQPICPTCQSLMMASAPEGLCAKCLWALLLKSESYEETSEDSSSTAAAWFGASADSSKIFGDYELLSEIAHGGMGVVYKARQISLNRVVALKMVRTARLPGEAEMKRFRAEAEAVAGLEHPNIVPIYEVGELDGFPYFTMKFVTGGSLACHIDSRRLNDRTPASEISGPEGQKVSAALVAKMARAIHYAHQRGVLHRDLKPSNILLDERGEPLVTDFGLAKQIDSDDGLSLTLSGTVLGTPAYMPPEQAAGGKNLTTAADVYSLGAIFYELIAGRPPFRADSAMETLRQVLEQEPRPPSSINLKVEKDLETICLKCLQKEPARRYGSAEALADDIERWLRREPIHARPSATWERALKWSRRHPVRAALAGFGILASATILTVLSMANADIRRERNNALDSEQKAKAAASRAETAAREAIEAKARTRQNLYAADMLLANQALSQGNLALARNLVEDYRPTEAEPSPDLLGFEWRYLWKQTRGSYLHDFEGHSKQVNCVVFSPDGNTLASASIDGSIKFWDVASRTLAFTWPGAGDSVRRLQFSPNGEFLVTANDNGLVNVWKVTDRKVVWAFNGHQPVRASFAGSLIAVYDNTQKGVALSNVRLFDWVHGREIKHWLGVGDLEAVSLDGEVMAISRARPPVVDLRNVATGEMIGSLTNVVCYFMALSPDHQKIAACSPMAKEVQLVDAKDRVPRTVLRGHSGGIYSLMFSPDSKTLATASADQSIRIWDVATQQETSRLLGHVDAVMDVAFSPDGRFLASAGKDRKVLLWPAAQQQSETISNAWAPYILSPDGKRLAGRRVIDKLRKSVVVWDLATHRPTELPESIGDIQPEFFSADSRVLFARGATAPEGALEWLQWDLDASSHGPERKMLHLGTTNAFTTGVSTPDRRLYAVSQMGVPSISLFDLFTGEVVEQLTGRSVTWGLGAPVGFSPNGQKLVSLAWPIHFRLVDRSEPEKATLTNVSPARFSKMAFSPDGSTIALACDDNVIRLWDAITFKEVGSLSGHQQIVTDVAFSPDSRTLASCGASGVVKLWCWPARREVASLVLPDASDLTYVAFTPDGNTLLAGGWSGSVYFWKAPALAEIPLTATGSRTRSSSNQSADAKGGRE